MAAAFATSNTTAAFAHSQRLLPPAGSGLLHLFGAGRALWWRLVDGARASCGAVQVASFRLQLNFDAVNSALSLPVSLTCTRRKRREGSLQRCLWACARGLLNNHISRRYKVNTAKGADAQVRQANFPWAATASASAGVCGMAW